MHGAAERRRCPVAVSQHAVPVASGRPVVKTCCRKATCIQQQYYSGTRLPRDQTGERRRLPHYPGMGEMPRRGACLNDFSSLHKLHHTPFGTETARKCFTQIPIIVLDGEASCVDTSACMAITARVGLCTRLRRKTKASAQGMSRHHGPWAVSQISATTN